MAGKSSGLIIGEFRRTVDDRYRLIIPPQLAEPITRESVECTLVKERAGCLSLWSRTEWERRFAGRIQLIEQRLSLGDLDRRLAEVQMLGRLLSTRHKPVELAGRNRLVIPEGFREFLGAEPNAEVMLIGAAVCVEIWKREQWLHYLNRRAARFTRLFARLS